MQSMKGQKVVIIGGSSGIGLATAKEAISRGAEVVIASRSEEKLKKAEQEIGKSVTSTVLDIANEQEIKDFFDQLGPFDHLTITGGVTSHGGFLDLESDAVRNSFTSKFFGQYFAARYGAPHIREGGSIVLISGQVGRRPAMNSVAVGAVNGAIESLGRALALELAPIRVNTLSPGLIKTPRHEALGTPEKREQFFAEIAKGLPAKRIGEPIDAAEAILFLMTNRFTTGTTLAVDGGFTYR